LGLTVNKENLVFYEEGKSLPIKSDENIRNAEFCNKKPPLK
jgi:hypothetical protein